MRLGLPENLERVPWSANLIENLFRRDREIGRRVKRWQNGTIVLRGSAEGVLEAERGFRKVVGYRALPILFAALRAHPRSSIAPSAGLTIRRRPLKSLFAAHSIPTAKRASPNRILLAAYGVKVGWISVHWNLAPPLPQ
jgi:hypothetical protein